mgnify:CR=1 FL=1
MLGECCDEDRHGHELAMREGAVQEDLRRGGAGEERRDREREPGTEGQSAVNQLAADPPPRGLIYRYPSQKLESVAQSTALRGARCSY